MIGFATKNPENPLRAGGWSGSFRPVKNLALLLTLLVASVAHADEAPAPEPTPAPEAAPAPAPEPAPAADAAPAPAEAAPAEAGVAAEATPPKAEKKEKLPYRGSRITYRNVASQAAFDRNVNLSDDPYYAMSWTFAPRWWFGDIVNVRGSFSLVREITNSNITTRRGETWPSDVRLGVGFHRFAVIPEAEIAFSGSFDVGIGASPISNARTMRAALLPSLRVSRGFDVLSGIGLGYTLGFAYYLNESQNPLYEESRLPGCVIPGECGAFDHTGVMNNEWRMTHSADLSVGFLEWLSLTAAFSYVQDHPFEVESDPRVTFEPIPPQAGNTRHFLALDFSLGFQPMKSLGITLGVSNEFPQLGPDSEKLAVFDAQYTSFYADITLDLAGLVTQITE